MTWSEADDPGAVAEPDCAEVPEEPVEAAASVETESVDEANAAWKLAAAALLLLGAVPLVTKLGRGSR